MKKKIYSNISFCLRWLVKQGQIFRQNSASKGCGKVTNSWSAPERFFWKKILICFLCIHYILTRGKSLLELWVTTFIPDWQQPLIFVRFISNFLCMCSNSMASAHVTYCEGNQTNIKGGCQSGRKVVPHDHESKSDLPLVINNT